MTGLRTQVVMLGFDALEVGIVRDMATAGKLPTFRRLLDGWACGRIQTPYGLFVGTLWTSFFTARSVALSGFHCWEAVSPASYERRPMTPRELVGRPFWRMLSEAGRRVAVLDVPHARAADPVNGLEVFEYGCHDRHFGFHTSPPELAAEIMAGVGPHPIFTLEPYLEREFAPDDYAHRAGPFRTPDEEKALLGDLLEGLDRKRRLSTSLLSRGQWDFFLSIFGESHAIGHQCWHVHDAGHPRHDPVNARALGDPVERVYAALDRALADHLALISRDTIVLVLLSHGMGPHYDGTHLLEEVLARIEAADWPRWRPTMDFATAIPRHLRGKMRGMLAPTASAARRRVRFSLPRPCFDGDVGPAYRASRRFFLSPNNSAHGGVRINLKGREPAGLIEPGREFDRTSEQLRHDLLALVNVDTGGPVVRSVDRTDAHYARASVDALPDLLIQWSVDTPIETVWSPKTAIVHRPYAHWRTGDHRPDGLLLAAGPGIRAGADLGAIAIGDLGPAICALLGAPLNGVGAPAFTLA